MLFLKHYKYSLFILFLFGVCPFVVHSSNKRVICTRFTWMYSILIYVTISISITCVFFVVFMEDDIMENFKNTDRIASFMEFFIVILVFVLTFALAILKSTVHLALINRLHELVSNLSLQPECSCCNMKNVLLRIAWKNIFTIFVYASFNSLGFFWFEDRRDASIIILYFLCGWGVLSAALAILHVKDVCDIVLHLSAHTRKAYIGNSKTSVIGIRKSSKVNSSFVFGFKMLMELHQIKDSLNNCFGAQILFGELKDFLITTTTIYYLISATVFAQIRPSWNQFIYTLIFIIPPVLKFGLLIRMFERIGKQV